MLHQTAWSTPYVVLCKPHILWILIQGIISKIKINDTNQCHKNTKCNSDLHFIALIFLLKCFHSNGYLLVQKRFHKNHVNIPNSNCTKTEAHLTFGNVCFSFSFSSTTPRPRKEGTWPFAWISLIICSLPHFPHALPFVHGADHQGQ